MLELQWGAQLRGETAGWSLRDSLFLYTFCYRLTSDKYRFDLILFDCQKGQKIDLTFLQPSRFEQEPSLCASTLGITRKSCELERTQGICAKAKCLCVISQIAHKFFTFLVDHWVPERGWRQQRQYWQLRGKVVPESIYSSTCPASPWVFRSPVHEPIPFTCRFDAYRHNSWSHLVPHAKSRARGIQAAFEYLAESWLCCCLFTYCVICSFSLSSDADNLSLYHWYDIVILGVLMRSNQSTVQCTASARWWMTAEV